MALDLSWWHFMSVEIPIINSNLPMKRIIYLFSAILCICGCAREIDWAPWSLYVIVENSDGKNILDTDTYDQRLSGTVLTYCGVDYELEMTPQTKMMAPVELNGFKIDWGSYYGNILSFGEFDGHEEFDEEVFTIKWPNGASNTITYSRKLNETFISAKEKWTLDGKKCEWPITIALN